MLKLGLGGLAAFSTGWLLASVQSQPTQLIFLSVGQGDCAVLRHQSYTILIDDGPLTQYTDAGKQIVAPKLRAAGVDRIDALLLSHPDMDHIGGTRALINNYYGLKILISDQFKADRSMLRHFKDWGVSSRDVVWLPEKTSVQLGDFHLFLECPRVQVGAPTNNGSMFVHLVDGKASAVFSGDAPIDTERQMETLEDWRSEIMKVGHHGSRTASDKSWIEAVHPEFAIISVGRGNVYGHPNREVLDRFADEHVKTLRTDLDGDVIFELRNGRFELINGSS